ncbi:P-loop ATPase, Sll1717 family [Phenylobacterium terrae]|uniref:P-loop ATPase, Sll1717 family n=1 Tax=Phenylobacterium terrae TaxID=2665495 RepID=A0ABW4N815_9CAUL
MIEVFVAYASGNKFHGDMIRTAAQTASTDSRKLLPWSERDTSGSPISESVESWVERAESFVADISVVNANVTYEIGLAIGLGKPVRLIRSTHFPLKAIQNIGLLDTLGHDEYALDASLVKVLKKQDRSTPWPDLPKNRDQPVFVLQPNNPTDWSLRITSAVKKIARLKYRHFNPWEISRLDAREAYEKTTSSYGVIASWVDGDSEEIIRNNQRAAFVFGLARGRGIPARLFAHEKSQLPLDLQDQATRWYQYQDIDKAIRDFRDEVADLQHDFVQAQPSTTSILEQVSCGDPTAENEASGLAYYFLETEGYQRALNGEANVLVGRKGSGKTAVFLQVRDRTRANKDNIIIDLIPDGYQLVKMKEFILDQLARGARKEVISAFWEYVLWLEIAYKLLEKDQTRAYRDPSLLERYRKLEKLFTSRVDTGAGDFSERLRRLSDGIIDRFRSAIPATGEARHMNSSEVLQIVYGQDVHELRETVSDYLRVKGFVFFLLDNLDRFWTPGGFTDDDALIVVGLIESMQEITRKLTRRKLDFRWAIFVRSDVYEFLIRGMADYGKLSVQSLEWSDRDLLKVMFERRVTSGARISMRWDELWAQASAPHVGGKPALDFLVDGSLMRPRYLIRLFETARRRAITFGRHRIEESDYQAALKELGWQVIEDLDREIADLVPDSSDLLFEILQANGDLTAHKFKYIVGKRLHDAKAVEKLLDIMLWNGSIGVMDGPNSKFIFDCGYKRQYLGALITADPDAQLMIHPSLVAALG